jgi:outer membrane protein assembly factor BamB
VGGPAASTVALDATTGDVRWRAGSGEAGYSSPRLANVHGRNVLTLFKGEAFTWMDPATGTVMGSHATTVRDYCNTILPAVAGSIAFVSNTGKDGTARVDLRGTEPSVAWRRPDLGMLFSSPVLWQGRLYAFNDAKRNENELVCLDAASGETRWTFGEVEKGAFILADGKMIVLTRQGELAVLGLEDAGPKVEARAQILGGKSYVEPVLAGGRLYCRNNEGQLVCLETRRPEVSR